MSRSVACRALLVRSSYYVCMERYVRRGCKYAEVLCVKERCVLECCV
jgi:hypothetical protein